jgi:hypothetical protein
MKCRKFVINRKRNVLFLISGMWYGIKENPVEVMERCLNDLIEERDFILDMSKKAYDYLSPLYPKVGERGCNFRFAVLTQIKLKFSFLKTTLYSPFLVPCENSPSITILSSSKYTFFISTSKKKRFKAFLNTLST